MVINVLHMANEQTPEPPDRFAMVVLPWLTAAGCLVVYLVTLNRWVSFQGLEVMGQVSGSAWRPVLTRPLNRVVFSFFKLLPEAFAPQALNIFAAILGAAILGLLARTVVLLQASSFREALVWNRSGRASMPAAWIPPTLAAAAGGLQLTFWEHATAISGEMINLLLLAYVVRCLFEFRVDGNERWLPMGTFCFGAGLANDWGFMGFLPVFLAALIWLMRMDLFNGRFLLSVGGSGLAGDGRSRTCRVGSPASSSNSGQAAPVSLRCASSARSNSMAAGWISTSSCRNST